MIRAIVFDCFGVLYENGTVDPEVVAIIASLRPKYRVGLLSNAYRSTLDRILVQYHLADHFDAVLGSSETAFIKPDREIFEAMARRLNVELSEILFIDDFSYITAAAENYGMRAITYRNPKQFLVEIDKKLK